MTTLRVSRLSALFVDQAADELHEDLLIATPEELEEAVQRIVADIATNGLDTWEHARGLAKISLYRARVQYMKHFGPASATLMEPAKVRDEVLKLHEFMLGLKRTSPEIDGEFCEPKGLTTHQAAGLLLQLGNGMLMTDEGIVVRLVVAGTIVHLSTVEES